MDILQSTVVEFLDMEEYSDLVEVKVGEAQSGTSISWTVHDSTKATEVQNDAFNNALVQQLTYTYGLNVLLGYARNKANDEYCFFLREHSITVVKAILSNPLNFFYFFQYGMIISSIM